MRYYVVSDIHSYFSFFREALTNAGFFTDKQPHKLIICGDLFDRGGEPTQLQEFVVDLMKKDEVILIRGNHEDMFEELVTVDEGRNLYHHRQNGTYSTALQLTQFSLDDAYMFNRRFAAAAQKTPFYQQILPAMVDYFETDNYVFVHGWIPCIKERNRYSYIEDWRNASPQEWAKARWYNGIDAAQSCMEKKTIVCGHWHASYGHAKYEDRGAEFGPTADFMPYHAPGIIAIDGCTAVSGRVNMLVIED